MATRKISLVGRSNMRGASLTSEAGVNRRAVHCAFFLRRTAPYRGVAAFPKDAQQAAAVPVALMQLRYDGKIGWFGGLVETGETIEAALVREIAEECGFHLGPERFQPVGAYDFHLAGGTLPAGAKETFRWYYYAVELRDIAELSKLESSCAVAEHFGSESWGTLRIQLATPHNSPELTASAARYLLASFPNALRHNFIDCAHQQLFDLMVGQGLASDKELRAIFQKAGLTLLPGPALSSQL